ncbi:T-complex protein 1 subunit epsilon [Symbiodinium microadriaticum]|uniref:T-complex protein 1 subunit epsilon n=1 Tax=Symbiodinium microadriaticum TaxID=2951 RepID=A0A1Q9DMH2_SYMMI|nr:T-complex protein 1 subunit epsilon [Symbiodinium microadriaticum]
MSDSCSLDLIEKGIHPLRIATGFEKACEGEGPSLLSAVSSENLVREDQKVAVKRVEEISKEQAALKKAATTALGSKVVSSRKDQLAKISVDAVLAAGAPGRKDFAWDTR